MEIKIDLDMNQIDYDAINKQIQEKIAALDIKDMYNVESKIDSKISNLVKDEVNVSYNKYIQKSFWDDGTTDDGRKLVENMIKAEITKLANQVIDNIFTEYNEEALRETMLKIMPDVFSSILFQRMESALFSKEYDYYNNMQNMVRSQIDSTISRMRY